MAADRYSVILTSFDEIEEMLKKAEALNLKWFIRPEYGSRNNALIFLFFDNEGMQKYLSGQWGDSSNGTEGAMYQERYCNKCWHDRNEDCPVWLAHLLDNGNDILDLFISYRRGNYEQCTMFVPISAVTVDDPIEHNAEIAKTFWVRENA